MQVLAVLECNYPQTQNFIVRGTVPLPPGFNYGELYFGINSPFTVLAPDGEELPTQCQVVAKYPNGDTSVVEISAVAKKPLSFPTGGKLRYRVIRKPQKLELPEFDQQLLDLSTTDGALRLRAKDVHGNLYETSLSRSFKKFQPAKKHRWYRFGKAIVTLELPQWLSSPGTPNSQPYLGGVHLWLTARANSKVLSVDLNFHNGGLEIKNDFFVLDDIYFESLELVMPPEWDVLPDWPEPMMGEAYMENGEKVVPLVAPIGNGDMHILPQRWEREWRLQVHLPQDRQEAEEIARNGTVAIAIDGEQNGRRYYNWRNPETARYLAQSFPTPDMSTANVNIGAHVNQKKNGYLSDLQNGNPHGVNGGGFGQLGYFNPHGAPYGGESGGEEIWQWPGVEVIESNNISDGITWARAVHRSMTDRHWGCIYFFDGFTTELDDHLNPNGTAPWDIFDSKFFQGKDLPWDFKNADDSQVNEVASQGKRPSYENALKQHDPQDYQHYCRRTWPAKILVWLDNDHLARRKLQMVAEIARMTYLTGPGEEMDQDIQFIKQYGKGLGTYIGRGEGWVMDACAHAYATGDEKWRKRWFGWFQEMHDILWDAQTPTGMWQALPITTKPAKAPPMNGQYRVCQSIEHGILANAVRGMLKSVFEGVDAGREQESRDMLIAAAVGMWDYAWAPGSTSPWKIWAVGPGDPSQGGAFTSLPFDGKSNGKDNFQIGSTIAYGLAELKPDSIEAGKLTSAIAAYTNSNSPLNWLLTQKLNNIQNRSPLIAHLQATQQQSFQSVSVKNVRPKKRRGRIRKPRR